MRVSDFIAAYLADHGVTTCFAVTGAAIADLLDAIDRGGRVKIVAMGHEQTAGFAAEALAKATGGLGVCLTTSGPGGINALTAVANAYYDSTPMLIITGQVNSAVMRRDDRLRQSGFQETDIVAMAKPVTKWAEQVLDAGAVRTALDRAIHAATAGRPGPVLIDLPGDIQRQDIDPAALRGWEPCLFPPYEDPAAFVATFLGALQDAARPIMLIGGGCRHYGTLVREAGRVLGIPVIPTWNAIDVVASDYELYRGRVGTYGGPGRNFAVQNADLLLAVGCRYSGRITGGQPQSFARGAVKFTVDIDRHLLRPDLQPVKSDYVLWGDAGRFLGTLIAQARHCQLPDFDAWLARTADWRDRYDPANNAEDQGGVNPYRFMAALSEQLTPQDVIVSDCGGNTVNVHQALKTKVGQRVISSHGNSPMGFALAGAIGAAYAPGVERVVCIIGDGGLALNVQELATLVRERLPVKVFMLDNRGYGIIRAYQDTNLGGRHVADNYLGYVVSWRDLCGAFDLPYVSSDDYGLNVALHDTWEHHGPVICHVDCGLWDRYEPRIFGWQTPVEDQYPYLSRAEFRANMLIEPWAGWEIPPEPGGRP